MTDKTHITSTQKKSTRGRKIPRASSLLLPGPITPAALALCFDRAKVCRPSADAINRLACILSNYKSFYLDAEQQRAANAAADEARKAIATLARTLPIISAAHDPLAAAGDPFAQAIVREINRLRHAVEATNIARVTPQSHISARDWRWLARVLPAIIGPVIGARGVAKGGPISRLLAAAIPLISGEAPSADAIATQIQKLSTGEN